MRTINQVFPRIGHLHHIQDAMVVVMQRFELLDDMDEQDPYSESTLSEGGTRVFPLDFGQEQSLEQVAPIEAAVS